MAKLFSIFEDKCILKMTALILKLQSDSLLLYVYSMYTKKTQKLEKRTKIYKYKKTIRRNFDVPVISSKWFRSRSASWRLSLESE